MLCYVVFAPAIGRTFVLWPGFTVQRLLRLVDISITNQFVFWLTLLFWWFTVWLVLRFCLPRSRLMSGSAALTCPFCTHQFLLTWRRYWKAPFGRHVCPGCGKSSRLRAASLFWVLYLSFLIVTPIAALVLGLLVVQVTLPQHFKEEELAWFLGSPWVVVTLIVLLALLLPVDRAVDVRFRRLQAPKSGKDAG